MLSRPVVDASMFVCTMTSNFPSNCHFSFVHSYIILERRSSSHSIDDGGKYAFRQAVSRSSMVTMVKLRGFCGK